MWLYRPRASTESVQYREFWEAGLKEAEARQDKIDGYGLEKGLIV
jgi:hypothetical protein